MAEIKYELAHVGINGQNPEEAKEIAALFADIFNLKVREGNSSTFAGNAVEVMRTPFLGKHGHIGMYTPDCEAAVQDLQARGYEADMSTAKYKPDGTLNAVYLKREVGGFAVHIVRAPESR